MNIFGFHKKRRYSAKDILKQLDACAKDYTFPILDNGYVYPVHSKLSAYRDQDRWAIIIEVIGFSYRGGGHDGITNCLHLFGNCLKTEPGTHNDNFLYLTGDSKEYPTFDEEYFESLNPKARTMLLRDKEIIVNHDREFYRNKGIELEEEDKIFVWEFLRGLAPEFIKTFEATEEEIRARIPADLPEIIALREWYHPDLADSELPSKNETFKQLAKVLDSGRVELYQPIKKPNNHWKNWPEGGTL